MIVQFTKKDATDINQNTSHNACDGCDHMSLLQHC